LTVWAEPDVEAKPARHTLAAWIYVGVGATIAAVVPWGLALNSVPVSSSGIRASLFIAMGGMGQILSRRIGLDILPTGFRMPLLAIVVSGACMAAYLVWIDAFVFRSALAPVYVAFIHTESLPTRLLYHELRSFNEGIVFQLFFGSMLTWFIGLGLRNDDRIAPSAYWIGLALGHFLNVCFNVFAIPGHPMTPQALAYDTFRYAAPGALWVYLYRRHGLTSALAANATTHLFLQPLLGILVT